MKKLLVICGPTASGKTALAVACAKRLGGEVVSADAYLVYRGLNIGTAKPTEAEMGGIPHHLIDVIDLRETFSASDYVRLATAAIEDIFSRGKVPVLCGGTGFYLSGVLFDSPYGGAAGSDEVRKKYAELSEKEGRDALHARLAEVDPESAAVLHPNDVKRVIRALEIFELTGKKRSDMHGGGKRYDYEAFAVNFPREELYRRIDARTQKMLEEGLIEEVERLLSGGVPENAQSMQAIGYKEVVESLKNGLNLSTMSDIISKNTRNYAKRQLTFFKKLPNLHWLAPKDIEACAEEVCLQYDGR